ncbi:hypothetical protein CPB86DRAFT_510008 [Serendipita vermifera]|nr:hypothetical protein CPB86DRAFT_510008 [Serendipita vermifera]
MSNTTPHSSSTPRPQPTQAMALQASSDPNLSGCVVPDEDSDDVVLLGSVHHLGQFTAQRSRLLKVCVPSLPLYSHIITPTSSLDATRVINVLLGDAEARQGPRQYYVPNPHHHLRSLWTETAEALNAESFVWGIFDDHTYVSFPALPSR